NNSAVEQARNVDDLLARGLGALVILAVQGQPAVSMVHKAVAEGVPVLNYNTAIPSGEVKGLVSRDNVAVGVLMAKAAMKDTGFRGNWAVISGDPGNAVAIEWTRGVFSVLDPLIKAKKMRSLVGHQWITGWAPDLSR